MRLSPNGSATKVSAKPTSTKYGAARKRSLSASAGMRSSLKMELHRVGEPLEEAGRRPTRL